MSTAVIQQHPTPAPRDHAVPYSVMLHDERAMLAEEHAREKQLLQDGGVAEKDARDAEIDSLRADLAMLMDAGDAMYNWLEWDGQWPAGVKEHMDEWAKAKAAILDEPSENSESDESKEERQFDRRNEDSDPITESDRQFSAQAELRDAGRSR